MLLRLMNRMRPLLVIIFVFSICCGTVVFGFGLYRISSVVANRRGSDFQVEGMRMFNRYSTQIKKNVIVTDVEIDSRIPQDNKKYYVFTFSDDSQSIINEEEASNFQVGDYMQFGEHLGSEITRIDSADTATVRKDLAGVIRKEKALVIISDELHKEVDLYTNGHRLESILSYLKFAYLHGGD